MDQVPFWLHRPLKRFIQYWSVVVSSLPAGILFVILLEVLPSTAAFAICFLIGLAMAYFAWHWSGKHILFAQRPRVLAFRSLTDISPDDSSFALAAGTLFVAMVVTGSQSTCITFPDLQDNEAYSANAVLETNNVVVT